MPRTLWHGLASPSVDDIDGFEAFTGRKVTSFTYFRSVGNESNNLAWETRFAQALIGRGCRPVLTLQPRETAGGVDQPAWSHAAILAGDHDETLTGWALALAGVNGSVVIRPMHEGNGTWYPWCAGVNGNTAESYKAAWRHMHALFVDAGAYNVRWQWSVNKVYVGGPTPLWALYPGHDVVNSVGISGYNGGTEVERGGWRSPATIFDETIVQIRRICTKPIYIAETACSEHGGDKPAWIRDLWAWVGARTEIAGVTWFNFATAEADWRVGTSWEAAVAYREAVMAAIVG